MTTPANARLQDELCAGDRVLVIAAVAAETSALNRHLAGVSASSSNPRIDVFVAGVGRTATDPVNAIQSRIAARPVAAVIQLGVAGGLDEALPAGSVVVIERWLDPLAPHSPVVATNAALTEALLARLSGSDIHAVVVDAVTVDAALHDAVAARQLHRSSGARIVEMEGAHWARALEADHDAGHGAGHNRIQIDHVPRTPIATQQGGASAALAASPPGQTAGGQAPRCAAIRIVSDAADQRLPAMRHELIRPDGRIRWGRWVGALVRKRRYAGGQAIANSPSLRSELASLLAARSQWREAMASLDRVSRALVAALTDSAGPAGPTLPIRRQ